MDNKKIEIGTYDVIETGSVIIPSSKPITFFFDELRFQLTFELEQDEKGNFTNGRSVLNVCKDEKGDYLQIALYNQDGTFFSTTQEVINVATYKQRKLYLQFCIMSINTNKEREDKLLFYTWYLQK